MEKVLAISVQNCIFSKYVTQVIDCLYIFEWLVKCWTFRILRKWGR